MFKTSQLCILDKVWVKDAVADRQRVTACHLIFHFHIRCVVLRFAVSGQLSTMPMTLH